MPVLTRIFRFSDLFGNAAYASKLFQQVNTATQKALSGYSSHIREIGAKAAEDFAVSKALESENSGSNNVNPVLKDPHIQLKIDSTNWTGGPAFSGFTKPRVVIKGTVTETGGDKEGKQPTIKTISNEAKIY